jgi:hypothetical protein
MQLQWKAVPHRQWIANGSRAVGGSYTIFGNHREDCGHFVPEFNIHYLGRRRRATGIRMGRYLPQVGATLDEAMALAQADHDALKA